MLHTLTDCSLVVDVPICAGAKERRVWFAPEPGFSAFKGSAKHIFSENSWKECVKCIQMTFFFLLQYCEPYGKNNFHRKFETEIFDPHVL